MENIISDQAMKEYGVGIGQRLRGGEVIELIGDVGAGKTTLTKGIAMGLEIDEDVQSPTFTINRTYQARDNLELHHYDFYRLADPGIMTYELSESLQDPRVITIIEWSQTVHDILPTQHIVIRLSYGANESRDLRMETPAQFNYLQKEQV